MKEKHIYLKILLYTYIAYYWCLLIHSKKLNRISQSKTLFMIENLSEKQIWNGIVYKTTGKRKEA